MNIKELNEMSGAELNELSATKVMGWTKSVSKLFWNERNVFIKELKYWNPTTDMNDAMELASKINGCLHLREHGKQGEWEANFCVYPISEANAETASRAITIASILAVQE